MRLQVVPQGRNSSDEALVHDGRQRLTVLHGQALEPEGDPITIELADGMSVRVKLLSYEDHVPVRDGSGSHTLVHGQEMVCGGKNVVVGHAAASVKTNVEATDSVAVEHAPRPKVTRRGSDE